MAQASPAILKSLSTVVKDSLTYVTLIEYMGDEFYLGLGRFSFYLIMQDLTKCKATIKYAHVERCLLDATRGGLM
jgi:hypothetical protein